MLPLAVSVDERYCPGLLSEHDLTTCIEDTETISKDVRAAARDRRQTCDGERREGSISDGWWRGEEKTDK